MSSGLLTFMSLAFLVAGIYFYKRSSLPIMCRALFSVLAFISVLLYIFFGTADYFTGEGINSAVVYHISQGLGGAGFMEYSELIAIDILALALGLYFSYWLFRNGGQNSAARRKNIYGLVIALVLSFLLSPATFDIYEATIKSSPSNAMVVREGEFFQYYKQPEITRTGENKNLVVIYAESLERTYFDESIFPGLITGLRKLESRSTTFTNIRHVKQTGWTIAGIVASLCGLPLFSPSQGNSMVGMDRFMPSALCLGDLLRNEGYHLAYYGGADTFFAGKKNFLTTHGFHEVRGAPELSSTIGNSLYRSNWGLYDDSLFDLVYRRFQELSKKGKPFVLMTLTLDTHHPNGHPSASCEGIRYSDGKNPMLNAVKCSDVLVSRLVERLLDSPYAANNVVVVASDHLAMRNTATDYLKSGDRTNMFMVIEPEAGGTEIDTLGSMLDFSPSILPFIGFKAEVGLGRDLVGLGGREEEIKHIHDNLPAWKQDIQRFWGFPEIKGNVTIDGARGEMLINGRKFLVPALVELSPELETTIYFDFFSEISLEDHVLALDDDASFFLVEHCRDMSKLGDIYGQRGLCLVAGKGRWYRNIAPLVKVTADSVIMTPEDIRYFTRIEGEGSFSPLRIAHADGAIEGKSYTNSFEALNENISKGFIYFELDFSLTSDGHLVCIHDWDHSFVRSFGFQAKDIPTLKEFKRLVKEKSRFDKCTLDRLITWMKDNPSAVIVTDVKVDNLDALRIMSEQIPGFGRRVIPQIYDPKNYDTVKSMGYERIIWTLYRYHGSDDVVMRWVKSFKGPFAITMSKNRAMTNLPLRLAKKYIPSYVHDVNDRKEANLFLNARGVTELYTDSLPPSINVSFFKEPVAVQK